MNELASQWYQAGSLFIQAGFLMAAIWSVRTIVKSIRVSQDQIGALLRLTLNGVRPEDDRRTNAQPAPYLLDSWPEIAPAPVHATTENGEKEGRRSALAGLIGWLREPMADSGIGQWRRMVRWLQAPTGS